MKAVIMWTLLGLSLPAWSQITTEQEVALGQRAAQQIESQVGVDNNPELNQRLSRVAQALVPVCGRNDIQYRFKVLNNEEFNAMALPGGFVYATRKLMNSLNDGELAFVLGHELTHVTQRHSIRQMESEQQRRLGIMAVLIGLTGGNVSRESAQIAGLVDQVFSNRFSQADEQEADRMGTEMLGRAGIDPAFALLGLRALAAQHGGGLPQAVNAIVGSHPLPQERIDACYGYIPTIGYSPGPSQAPSRPNLNWQDDLLKALRQVGWRDNQALMAAAKRELEDRQFQAGNLLVSPAGETYNQMERRLFSQRLAWLQRLGNPQRQFGLAVVQAPRGEHLIWLKVSP